VADVGRILHNSHNEIYYQRVAHLPGCQTSRNYSSASFPSGLARPFAPSPALGCLPPWTSALPCLTSIRAFFFFLARLPHGDAVIRVVLRDNDCPSSRRRVNCQGH
jgi:hypothetical protein